MFHRLLNRNIIMMMLPLIIILIMFLMVGYKLSMLSEYSIYDVDQIDSVEQLHNNGIKNISISLKDMEINYAGFDYEVNDKVLGKYYYYYHGNEVHLLVLEDGFNKDGKINARIQEDKVTANYIQSSLAETFNVKNENLDGFIKPYIINQIEFPAMKIKGIDYMKKIAVVLIAISILYIILAMIRPELNFETKELREMGDVRALIKELDEEMKEAERSEDGNEYTTPNYHIIAMISYIKVTRKSLSESMMSLSQQLAEESSEDDMIELPKTDTKSNGDVDIVLEEADVEEVMKDKPDEKIEDKSDDKTEGISEDIEDIINKYI